MFDALNSRITADSVPPSFLLILQDRQRVATRAPTTPRERLRPMPSDPQPLVSILTPSFNQAAWLPDNLRSVACQTYPRIEHIVTDGGSTDGSVELLQAAGDSVLWRSEPDTGQADAINKAFARSTGEIIGWINSDDAYFDCRVIEDVVAYFAAHPDVDVVYGHGIQTTDDGAIIQMLWAPPFDAELLQHAQLHHAARDLLSPRRPRRPAARRHLPLHDGLRAVAAPRATRPPFSRIDRITAIDRHQPARKSSTMIDVHEQNLGGLPTTYAMRLGPEHNRQRSRFYLRQRVMGALLIPRIHPTQFAFSAPANPKAGLLRRQIASRRSSWPAEYR